MKNISTFTTLKRRYMKKILLPIILGFAFAMPASAQSAVSEESNCYLKWVKKFEERGADAVEDGTYDNVIITFRQGTRAECYNGKVDVKAGKITNMFLRFEGGAYEPVEKKFKYEKMEVTVTNGISKTIVTTSDELINVIFPKKLKPKKAAYEKAPEPGIDD